MQITLQGLETVFVFLAHSTVESCNMEIVALDLTTEPGEHLMLAIMLPLPFIESSYVWAPAACLSSGSSSKAPGCTIIFSRIFCQTK